jgi:CHAT domain-containing protein
VKPPPRNESSGDRQAWTSLELDVLLRELRHCSILCASDSEHGADASEGFEASLEEARKLAATGLYRNLQEAEVRAKSALEAAHDSRDVLLANQTLALIRLQLGDHAGALQAAQDAEGAARLHSDVTVRIAMARLVAQTGDLERAGTALADLGPLATTPAARAEWLEARGELALRLGSPSQALRDLEAALREHEALFGTEEVSTAKVRHLLGDAHRMARDFPAASGAYREALRVRVMKLGPNHPDSAATANAIGVLRADLGDWSAADKAFASAIERLEQSLGPEHPETLSVRLNRALVAWQGTRGERAAERYSAALQALRGALGNDHPSIAISTRTLARIEFERGHAERAQKLLGDALAAQLRTLGPGHPDTAFTLSEYARLLMRGGKLDEAGARLCEATRALDASLGHEHALVARYRSLLVRNAVARDAPAPCLVDEPEADHALSMQKTTFEEAIEAARVVALNIQRSFGAMTERQRTLLARDSHEVVGALLSISSAPRRETYQALIPHRDSVVRSIATSRAVARERNPEVRQILSELAAKRRRYVASVSFLEGSAETAQRSEQLAREIDELEVKAAAAGAHTPDPKSSEILAAACSRLRDDTALVEFVKYDRTERGARDETIPHYAAWVIVGSRCEVTRVDLGPAALIEQATEQFDQAMRDLRWDAREARVALSRLLLAPLAEPLRDTTRWFVVPDSRLWGVPLSALPDPKDGGGYLLQRVAVGYLTSVFELAQAPREHKARTLASSLLFGAPDFGSAVEGGPIIVTSAGPCALRPFPPLPGTLAELHEIKPILANALGALPRLVTGADATKGRLLEQLAQKPALIHLATHGYFAGRDGCPSEAVPAGRGVHDADAVAPNPLLLSGVVFAGANVAARIDTQGASGILTAYEIAGLDLRDTRLVVLSACDTGAGLAQRGQEVQGLRWGFRAAGATALVTSLWEADDEATRALMRHFYEALAELPPDGFRGAEALRRAQLMSVRDEQRHGVHKPFLWANFVFSGIL